ncbi:ATP-binding protein [Hamadaea tsunoensis]|uniref:ATP-binding protein n=1 Tax=Hamadaea tsunoensis TaxID=53368 RepID=UPI00042683DE|nr:ATP-binding protein [Hamadaea tsunoensis]
MDVDIPWGPEAPTAARKALRAVLSGWGLADRDWLDNAELVVSELVSNALTHGDGCHGVTVEHHHGQVIISVADGSEIAPTRAAHLGGLGMRMVVQLSARWGVDRLFHGGKRVWVQLPPCPPSVRQREGPVRHRPTGRRSTTDSITS